MAGAPTSEPKREQPHLRIHAVNVYVRDQDRSLSFYLDQLGFDLAFDARLPDGQRWVAVSPPDGTAVLTLIAPSPERPNTNSSAAPRKLSLSRKTCWRSFTNGRRAVFVFVTPRACAA